MEPLFRDISTSPLYQLLDDLQQLIQHVLKRSTVRISQHISTETDKSLNKSIVNLAHYLALRELDLRPLQERLAEAGGNIWKTWPKPVSLPWGERSPMSWRI